MDAQESELVLNADGSVYHLQLKAEDIADYVLLVGDPKRVANISERFDRVEVIRENREFVCHTGWYSDKRITALSTGIGTDNIDIVVNELDAAVNFDPITRNWNREKRRLTLIRLGTCGALQADLAIDSVAITEFSIGLDGVRHFYDIEVNDAEALKEIAFRAFIEFPDEVNTPYVSAASPDLLSAFQHLGRAGITLCANGFFGPQGRFVRLPLRMPDINAILPKFEHGGLRILNYEMESSALYALGKALGHRVLCLCVVVANRPAGKFSKDYYPAVNKMIDDTLKVLTELDHN